MGDGAAECRGGGAGDDGVGGVEVCEAVGAVAEEWAEKLCEATFWVEGYVPVSCWWWEVDWGEVELTLL